MEDIRKMDPTFTGFVPRTAAEAVDRYVRCRRNGLKPMLVPECLIACAAGLPPDQMGFFEDWIINPNGSLEGLDLVPNDRIRAENEKLFLETEARVTEGLGATPPVPEPPDRSASATPVDTPST